MSKLRDTPILSIALDKTVTALRQPEELLRWQADLLEQAYEPLIAWDLTGPIVYWNRGARGSLRLSERSSGRPEHPPPSSNQTSMLPQRD